LDGAEPDNVTADGLQLNGSFVSPKGLQAKDCFTSVSFRADDDLSRPELRIRYQNEQSYYCIAFDVTKHWTYLTWGVGAERNILAPGFTYWFGKHWYNLAFSASGSELAWYVNGVKMGESHHSAIQEGGIQFGALGGRVTFRDLQVQAYGSGDRVP